VKTSHNLRCTHRNRHHNFVQRNWYPNTLASYKLRHNRIITASYHQRNVATPNIGSIWPPGFLIAPPHCNETPSLETNGSRKAQPQRHKVFWWADRPNCICQGWTVLCRYKNNPFHEIVFRSVPRHTSFPKIWSVPFRCTRSKGSLRDIRQYMII